MAWFPTNAKTTMTVTADNGCVPHALMVAGCGVLVQVLSGAINYTMTDPGDTPGKGDFLATVGDQFFMAPSIKLRFTRNSADSCVTLQAWAGQD